MPTLVHAPSLLRCLSPATARASSGRRVRAVARTAARAVALAVVPAFVLAACGRGTITDGVTDSAFVATMAELERVERAPGLDSSARVAARTTALQRRGLTQAQMEAAAGALADDPRRALAIWRAIDRKVSGDTTPPAPPGAPVPATRRR
jgi:hypothetical protein